MKVQAFSPLRNMQMHWKLTVVSVQGYSLLFQTGNETGTATLQQSSHMVDWNRLFEFHSGARKLLKLPSQSHLGFPFQGCSLKLVWKGFPNVTPMCDIVFSILLKMHPLSIQSNGWDRSSATVIMWGVGKITEMAAWAPKTWYHMTCNSNCQMLIPMKSRNLEVPFWEEPWQELSFSVGNKVVQLESIFDA